MFFTHSEELKPARFVPLIVDAIVDLGGTPTRPEVTERAIQLGRFTPDELAVRSHRTQDREKGRGAVAGTLRYAIWRARSDGVLLSGETGGKQVLTDQGRAMIGAPTGYLELDARRLPPGDGSPGRLGAGTVRPDVAPRREGAAAKANLDEPRYLLVARMPAEVRDAVKHRIEADLGVRNREAQLFRLQLSARPPVGTDSTYSLAQQQRARGLAWKRLAWELGLWQPPDVFPPPQGGAEVDLEVAVRPRRRSSALTSAQRAAIEHRAVAVATQHLEREGWSVEDVGAVRSYDLHCTDHADRTLYVEVKGTTGRLESIVLTANEVAVARAQHPHTALFVIHDIKLTNDAKRPTATGGTIHEIRPWSPDSTRLEAKVYAYWLG